MRGRFWILVSFVLFFCRMGASKTFYDISIDDINGQTIELKSLKGKAVLVANVASYCGFTDKGYEDLGFLYDKFGSKGLEIIAVPCNQFGKQEPDDNFKINHFATTKKGAKYIIADKVDVNGDNTHDLFRFLKGEFLPKGQENPFGGKVGWNFEYFLVGKDGEMVKRWKTGTDMKSAEVVEVISKSLQHKAEL